MQVGAPRETEPPSSRLLALITLLEEKLPGLESRIDEASRQIRVAIQKQGDAYDILDGYEGRCVSLARDDSTGLPHDGIIGIRFLSGSHSFLDFGSKTLRIGSETFALCNEALAPGTSYNARWGEDESPLLYITYETCGQFVVDTRAERNSIKLASLDPGQEVERADTVFLKGFGSDPVETLGSTMLPLLGQRVQFHVVANELPIPGGGVLGTRYFSQQKLRTGRLHSRLSRELRLNDEEKRLLEELGLEPDPVHEKEIATDLRCYVTTRLESVCGPVGDSVSREDQVLRQVRLSHLSDEERQRAELLVREFSDLFYLEGEFLTTTNVAEHRISAFCQSTTAEHFDLTTAAPEVPHLGFLRRSTPLTREFGSLNQLIKKSKNGTHPDLNHLEHPDEKQKSTPVCTGGALGRLVLIGQVRSAATWFSRIATGLE
ncbi:hypothetical protein QAD02_017102 [Eretmocerus hayati]|uniref:Uncharacterized protein n=1 Tax=Eretmocerus hayati TaxID=131215 RepID=A0ACC2PHR1_9HYME|nr:hypothetical protein QAD02_017102 [Eretmocerus hayati]